MTKSFVAMLGVLVVPALFAQGGNPASPAAGTGKKESVVAKGSQAAAPAWTKKTPWGEPDLQGIWNNGTTAPLERPAAFGTRAELTTEELLAKARTDATRSQGETAEQRAQPGVGAGPTFWYEIGRTSKATSQIIDPPDGRLPSLSPAGQQYGAERQKKLEEIPLDSFLWKHQGQWVRCITRGVPNGMIPTVYNNNYQILQIPGYFVMYQEMIHTTRIIPTDGRPHLPASIKQWMGDSVGHWEGQTLVVETTNFNPEAEFNRAPGGTAGAVQIGTTAKVVERFTRQTETEMDYRFTLDAPAAYTKPFTAVIPMTTVGAPSRIMEYACIEGDHSVPLSVTALITQKALKK